MGLLDPLLNLNPEQTQGLLAAAAQMVQQSGPSRMPSNFMDVALGGANAFTNGVDAARRRKMEEEQAAMQKQLYGLKLRDAQSDFDMQEASRKRAVDLQSLSRDYFAKQSRNTPLAVALSSMNGPTLENAATLANLQSQPLRAPSRFDMRMGYADHLRQSGYNAEAEAEEKSALQFQPKVKSWEKVTVGNRVLLKPYFEDGSSGDPVPAEVAEKLNFQDIGGSTVGLSPYTGEQVSSVKNTQSPNNIANNAVTMRGQNLVSDRAREANVIAARNGAIAGATGLRKEFDDLPEVKSYKQALPAYKAIVDAGGRNTTQADINLVYGIAKLYDPNSVVREGEYATVANSPNIPEKVKGWAQYLAGGGRLTPAVKAEILAEARGRIGAYEGEYTKARNGFGDVATRTGLDPQLVLPTEFKPAGPSNPNLLAEMPKANGSNKGKVMKDHDTGKQYRSNGMQWVEIR